MSKLNVQRDNFSYLTIAIILLLLFSGSLTRGDATPEEQEPPASIRTEDPREAAAGVLYLDFDQSENRHV